MTGPAIPPGAVRAAAEGIHGLQCCAAPCESADEHIEAIEECKGLATVALEAAAAAIAGAERERLAAGTRCITPCDDDCELQPDGCHELHQIPRKRTHLPQFCADIRAAIGAAAAAERERCARLAEKAGAIYPLPRPVPAVTVNGEPAGDTAGNTVIWPDGMPAVGLVSCLLREQP